jgi:hypothetical protein
MTGTLDLRDAEAVASAPPARKLLCLVLLVAAKDGASEVRFEPVTPGDVLGLEFPPWAVGEPREVWAVPSREQWNGCRLRYRVAGNLYDMIPAPFPVPTLFREVASLARLGFFHRPVRFFRRWWAASRGALPGPREGRLRLLVVGKAVEVRASLSSTTGPLVLLLSPGEASQEAGDLLARYCRE